MKLLLEAKDPSGQPQEVEVFRAGGVVHLSVDEWPSASGGVAAVALTTVEAAQLCNALRQAIELDLEPARKAPKYGVAR